MKLLITGAAGMLATDLQAAARAAGHELDAATRTQLDITDSDAVNSYFEASRPEVVINCAAYNNVDAAEGDGREAAHAINVTGPGNLARAAAMTDARIIHISTDYVFPGTKSDGPYVESDSTGPRSAYGASKLEGELAVAQAAPASHTIVRTAWVFGQHGSCFPATILRLATERDQLSVVDDQRGCPTFTVDLAQALLTLAEAGADDRVLGVVHVAGGGECSWFEFAQAIVASAGLKTTLKPCTTADFPRPAPRPAYSVLRSERGEDAPVLRDWREGLRDYLELMRGATQ